MCIVFQKSNYVQYSPIYTSNKLLYDIMILLKKKINKFVKYTSLMISLKNKYLINKLNINKILLKCVSIILSFQKTNKMPMYNNFYKL